MEDTYFKKQTTLRIDNLLWKEFRKKCFNEGRTMTYILERLIKQYLEDNDNENDNVQVRKKV